MARVFLSHARVDKPTVRRIADALRAAGHQPWLDEDEILIGQSIPAAVETALREADFVVICLSKAAAARGWVEAERAAALMQQLCQRKERILPVRLEDVEPPYLIASLACVDLFPDAASFERGIVRLMQSIAAYQADTAPDLLASLARVPLDLELPVIDRYRPSLPALQFAQPVRVPMLRDVLPTKLAELDPALLGLSISSTPTWTIKTTIKAGLSAMGAGIVWLLWENDTVRTILYGTVLVLAWICPPIMLLLVMRGKVKRDTANTFCLICLGIGVIAIATGIVTAVQCHIAGNDLEHLKASLPGLALVVDDAQQKLHQVKPQLDGHEASTGSPREGSAALGSSEQRLADAQKKLSSAKLTVAELEDAPHTTGAMVLRIALAATGLLHLMFALLIFTAAYMPQRP